MDEDSGVQLRVTAVAHIACAVCQHEIPLSEAVNAEATDYVVNFCGLDCYERWRESRSEPA